MKSLKATLKRLSILNDKEKEERKESRVRGGLTRLNNSLNKINEFIININSIDSKVTLEVISNSIKLDKENIRRRLTEEQKEIIKSHNKLIKYNKFIKGINLFNSINSINSIELTPDRRNIGIFQKTEESREVAQILDIEVVNKPSENDLNELSQEISSEPILDIHLEDKIDLNASMEGLTDNQKHYYKKLKELGFSEEEVIDILDNPEELYEGLFLVYLGAFKKDEKKSSIVSIESHQIRNSYGDEVDYDTEVRTGKKKFKKFNN